MSVSDEDITAIVIFTAGPLVSRRLLLLLLLLPLLLLPEPLPVVGVRVGEAVGAAVSGIVGEAVGAAVAGI